MTWGVEIKCLNTVGTILCTPLNQRTARFRDLELYLPTYLPTLASDRALQKLYAMLPTFQTCSRIETFQTLSNYLRLTYSLLPLRAS